MKSGISLVDMAKEIQRQADLKADYMLDTRSLRLEPFDSKLYLNAYDQSGVPALEPLEVNSIAHRQIGTHLKIPAAYYDKMLEEYPELLAQNVNAWFQREPSVRMIRTIEGTARAFLSNRYRRIDNLDIASIVLPVLQDMEGMHFESCQLTESRMYIKVVNTRLEAEVVPGDIVQSGIIISNSEVGLGSVNIQPLVYRLVTGLTLVAALFDFFGALPTGAAASLHLEGAIGFAKAFLPLYGLGLGWVCPAAAGLALAMALRWMRSKKAAP